MKVQQLLDVLEKTALLLEGDGSSEKASILRAFANAIVPMQAASLDALLEVLGQVELDTNGT